jgi:hypothetical protein
MHTRERGEEGGTSCTPSKDKDSKNLDHKNAIKHENRRPHSQSKEFENDCALNKKSLLSMFFYRALLLLEHIFIVKNL